MSSAIVHFEIPAEDRVRAKAFYGALFGWTFEDVDGMEYTLVKCSDQGPNGGITKRNDTAQGLLNYIDVPDVAAFQRKAEKLGATVLVPRAPVPSIGWFAVLRDTEGNTFALWQDDEYAGL